jgi:hypothetical protein
MIFIRFLAALLFLSAAAPALAQTPASVQFGRSQASSPANLGAYDNSSSRVLIPLGLINDTAHTFQLTVPVQYQIIDPRSFGAVCDGSTNDTAPLNSLLASFTGIEVRIPQGKSCYSATGITVPSGARLVGQAFNSEDPTLFTGGSRMKCPQNISTPCVTIGSGNIGANSASLEGVIVQGVGSATLTQGIGVKVDGVFGVTLRDVMAYNFYQGYYLNSYNQAGIGAVLDDINTGAIKDAHLVIDSWPEVHITNGRFGVVGGNDLGADTYIRFQQKNNTNLSGAANTFTCVSCQFNESGTNSVTNAFEFVNNQNTLDGTSEYKFIGGHLEHVLNGFYSDSTWTSITQLYSVGSEWTINGGAGQLFNFNAATAINALHFTANHIGGKVTLQNAQISNSSSQDIFTDNSITGAASFQGNGTGGHLTLVGNDFGGGLSIGGIGWTSLSLVGNTGISGLATGPLIPNSTLVEMGPNEGLAIAGPGSTLSDIIFANTSLGTDGKVVRLVMGTGGFALQFQTDNLATANSILLCPRSAALATDCVFGEPVSGPAYTIAGLPTCGSSAIGFAYVTNGVASPAYNAVPSTTGSTVDPVFCNGGGSWTYH